MKKIIIIDYFKVFWISINFLLKNAIQLCVVI